MVNRAVGPVWLAAFVLLTGPGSAQAQMQSFTLPPEVSGGAPMGAPLSLPSTAQPAAPAPQPAAPPPPPAPKSAAVAPAASPTAVPTPAPATAATPAPAKVAAPKPVAAPPPAAQPAAMAAPMAISPLPSSDPKAKPGPVVTVTVTNASASIATEVTLSSGDMITKLGKPLGPKEKVSLKLIKLKGCTVSLAATFEDEGQVDAGEFDVCKDKSIRFTD